MSSPIRREIGMVFIPVSDMERAIGWYSQLFGLPVQSTTHGGKIYDLRMGDVTLILDGHKPVVNSSQPLAAFWTDDIHAADHFLRQHNADVVSAPDDIGSVTTLVFKDPDGNLLMVCQRNPPLTY
jgi:predicted enzyme related to lactoylglutathione lyase